MSAESTPIAELGMYPFESVRWAWEALWEAVRANAGWTPPQLAFSGDVHARWHDPACVVNHVCGYPLARWHADRQRVVGTFRLTIPEAVGHRYRSTLLSPLDVPLSQLVAPTTRAVANSEDSLSGWISLLAATVGVDAPWPGRVRFTSTHYESLRVLATGGADLACIDSWSLALIERQEPGLTAGLHRIGLGPLVPGPAITVGRTVAGADAEALAAAFEIAIADPATAEVRSALCIDGFERTTIDEYLALLDLTQSRRS
jgi:ABC-type phosphate/phosphonate transport system substrate-binding protein